MSIRSDDWTISGVFIESRVRVLKRTRAIYTGDRYFNKSGVAIGECLELRSTSTALINSSGRYSFPAKLLTGCAAVPVGR